MRSPNRHPPGSSPSVPADPAFQRALARIEQLEGELQQKDALLDRYLKEQLLLRESLQACIQTIQKTSKQINSAGSDLKKDYRQLLDRIAALEQENKVLEGSNDAWSHRSITLEFDVLSAQAQIKKMKAAHELAVSIIALQEMELKTVNIENHRLRQQSGQNANQTLNDLFCPEAWDSQGDHG